LRGKGTEVTTVNKGYRCPSTSQRSGRNCAVDAATDNEYIERATIEST
jgi:hypothetical protein